MNTASSTSHESFAAASAATAGAISPMRILWWSVQRELWEYRSIYIAPLIAAAVALFGFLVSAAHLPGRMRAALALSPMEQHEAIGQPYGFAALLIMGSTFIVALLYCLEALQSERRDRSILFWKSLPVSDLTTILSKVSIPLLVLPLVTFVITVATQIVMLVIHSAILSGSGLRPATLWTQLSPFRTWFLVFYHLFAFHSLWYAPIYGWLLLVSSWAKRLAFLWASLPLLAIGIVERIAFNTSKFAGLIGQRIGGGGSDSASSRSMSVDAMTHFAPLEFLTSPGLWIGLALTAVFLAIAVQLRRSRDLI